MIHRTQEDGVSLILVLVTLVVFGLLVPVLGQFGSVNGVSGYVLKEQRFDRYLAADGMQGAIAWLQAHRPGGRDFADCPPITSSPLADSKVQGYSDKIVTVECQGMRDSGLPQQTESTPAYALLALAQTGSDAIDVSGGGSIRTSGAWWSNSGTVGDHDAIDVEAGTAVDASQDLVGGQGQCRNIVGTPTRCDLGTPGIVPDPGGGGTAWTYDLPQPIRVDPPRGDRCPVIPPSHVVAIEPGLHWELPWFDKLTDGEDCSDVVLWFMPGTHVFDFGFYRSDPGGRIPWTIRPRGYEVAIVGGQPSGWKPDAGTSQVSTVRDLIGAGGACGPGSTMALGADSAIRVVAPARIEVCGAGAPQALAVTQVTQGVPMDGVRSQSVGPMTPDAVQASNVSGFPTIPPDPNPLGGSECVPGPCDPSQFASGTIRGSRELGTVTMTIPNEVPENARVESLQLTIVHRESSPGDISEMRVRLSGLPGLPKCSLANGGETPEPTRSWTESTYDCPMSDVEQPFTDVPDLRVEMDVLLDRQREGEPTPESGLSIDQVAVAARFQRVAYRNSRPTDDVLRVDAGAAARMDGTVYTPTGDVRLDLGGSKATSTRRGVVANRIDIRDLPNDETWAPFSLPNGGTYADRLVTLAATVEGDSGPTLTARVQFCDAHPDYGARIEGCPTGAEAAPPRILRWQPSH